jgi:hypothetical protein
MANIIVIMFDTPNTHTVLLLLLLSIPFYLAINDYFSCTDVLQSVIESQNLYCTVL